MGEAPFEELTADDLELAAGEPMPLRFVAASTWSPVLLSFPHVGLLWPSEIRPKPQVDLARNADYEVQTLYGFAPSLGAAQVRATYSRLVVDLNRAHDDVSPALVPDHPAPRPRMHPGSPQSDLERRAAQPAGPGPGIDALGPGRGVVWAHALGNIRLVRPPLSYAAFDQRIRRYHTPYYKALEVLLKRRRARFGYAILLDAHSMPGVVSRDLVISDLDGRSAAPGLRELAHAALASPPPSSDGTSAQRRWRVAVNDPYRGGELIRRFGRPDEGLHALQLEVNRSLYMDETRWALWPTSSTTAANRPPPPNKARDLAQLSARVKCLIGRLTRDCADLGLQPPSSRAAGP